jgi:hypothetical protein
MFMFCSVEAGLMVFELRVPRVPAPWVIRTKWKEVSGSFLPLVFLVLWGERKFTSPFNKHSLFNSFKFPEVYNRFTPHSSPPHFLIYTFSFCEEKVWGAYWRYFRLKVLNYYALSRIHCLFVCDIITSSSQGSQSVPEVSTVFIM